jgi:hypothetical protein
VNRGADGDRDETILGRPVLMPNLAFASIVFWLALGAWRRSPDGSRVLLAVAAAFGALALAFGARLFAKGPAGGVD